MAEIANLLTEFISRLDLSEEVAQTFAEGGRVATIRRGESVVRQGEVCRHVIAILEGTFEAIACRSDGQQRLLGFAFTNEFVTDYPAFLAQSAARYTIQAITDCTVLLFPYEHTIQWFEYNMETQRFGRRIAELIMAEREERMLSFHMDTPEERYLKMLERCKDLDKQVSLKDIASMINVTPETVSRIRKKILLENKS
ncbi:Crp/Fnr family transcriptional regulator [Parabacteroides sp.]